MAPPLRVAPGQTLEGRFLIVEEVARGGMSVVFKARDLQDDGRAVAVKVPLPQYSSGVGSWSLVQREVEIGLRLDHPYVLRFLPLGPNPPRGLVVTEFVSGKTLAERIAHERRIPEVEALRIAARLCEAVAYLHAQSVVHYDLKPGNVMLCDDGSLRVIDFGMAHPLVKGRFSLAGPAPAIVTANYVAPEQLRRVRGRTSVDVYAIGAILYEMLSGRPPFDGDDPFVVASARQIGDPRPPRAIYPALSEQAEEIVLRALRRLPAERYPSASALGIDLENPERVHVSGLAQRLVEVTPWRKRARLMRYVVAVAVAPVFAMVGLFVVLWWYLGHAR